MKFQISTNGYNVISSNTVILFDSNSELKISATAIDGFSFDVILRFIKNTEEEKNLHKAVSGNTITFECINFDNALGTGTVAPLLLATVEGKDIYMHFWVYLMGDSGKVRKVEYTFLVKE